MEAFLWILLPGFVALTSGLLAWFVMQSRMDVRLAEERERVAMERGTWEAEKAGHRASFEVALRAAQETAKREAFDKFLSQLTVEQRHYTRQNRMLLNPGK